MTSADARPDWDDWAMGIARAVARRADCTRRQVGAVIIGHGNQVVSTGYNGTKPGRIGCLAGGCPRGHLTQDELPSGSPYDDPASNSFCIATHGEMNALLQADPLRLPDAVMYLTTEPCRWCLKVIANTPIRRIIYPDPNRPDRLYVKLV